MLSATAPAEIYAFLIILVRVGAFLSLLPALGESMIPARIRLGAALAIALILVPSVSRQIPAMPDSPFVLAGVIATELGVGLFIAGMMRILFTALHVAGTVIGLQSGLSFAMTFDPSQGQQSVLFSNFLAITGIAAIFAANLHLLMLQAIVHCYEVFPPGRLPPVGDFAQMGVRLLGESFEMGLRMSAPFIVFGLLFNLGLGVLNRLMPAMQIFFIGLPLQVLGGLVLLAASVGTTMNWFLGRYEAELGVFLGRG